MKQHNKRGVTHIEMIISLTVFLLFLLFLISYLNPVKQPDISGTLLDIVERGIERAQFYIMEIPVALYGAQQTDGCFNVECPFDVNQIGGAGSGGDRNFIFVENDNGQELDFELIGDGKNIAISYSSTPTQLYHIYLSDKSFTSKMLANPELCPVPPNSYKFSVPRLTKVYSYNDLQAMKTKYDTKEGYASLKKEFKFPDSMDFAIIITPGFEMSKTKPAKGVVKARDIPIEMFKVNDDNSKEVIKANLNIQVW